MTVQLSENVLSIDFLFLDRDTCGRCGGTEEALDMAVSATEPALAALGIRSKIAKIHVTSLVQAKELGFLTSPTIRIGGKDIQSDMHESACGDCTDLGASDDAVHCRHWTWHGESHSSAPVGMVVEAILSAVLEGQSSGPRSEADPERVLGMTANLERFFGPEAGATGGKGDGCGCGCG
ncbi:DUF2703 domain-containing protein [Rhodospirillum sp. A1_3_36]|uniref:DUF2703 domain-containing protein n=1 Tax=Rhodospirillum sp. A1_3_36 TaxID=3391666 RepID=UPI0039A48309